MAKHFLTGEEDGDNPIQPIVNTARNVASGAGQALFGDPQSRAALLQIGLNLMQPPGFGQTAGGHIASAIGSGGELVARQTKEDLERQKQESEEEYKSRSATSREKEAEAYVKNQGLSAIDRAMQLQQMKDAAAAARLGTKNYAEQAKRIWEHIKGLSFDAKNIPPDVAPFVGKKEAEIEKMLRESDPESSVGSGGVSTTERQKALDWLKANPTHPKAQQVRERLGVQ